MKNFVVSHDAENYLISFFGGKPEENWKKKEY